MSEHHQAKIYMISLVAIVALVAVTGVLLNAFIVQPAAEYGRSLSGEAVEPWVRPTPCVDPDGYNNFDQSTTVTYRGYSYQDKCVGDTAWDYNCRGTSSTPTARVVKDSVSRESTPAEDPSRFPIVGHTTKFCNYGCVNNGTCSNYIRLPSSRPTSTKCTMDFGYGPGVLRKNDHLLLSEYSEEESHIVTFLHVDNDGVVTLRDFETYDIYQQSCLYGCTIMVGDTRVNITFVNVTSDEIFVYAGCGIGRNIYKGSEVISLPNSQPTVTKCSTDVGHGPGVLHKNIFMLLSDYVEEESHVMQFLTLDNEGTLTLRDSDTQEIYQSSCMGGCVFNVGNTDLIVSDVNVTYDLIYFDNQCGIGDKIYRNP